MELFKKGYIFKEYPPTTIKKQFVGSGRASKEEMVNNFNKQTELNLYDLFLQKKPINKIKPPITDIADSYAITKVLLKNYGDSI